MADQEIHDYLRCHCPRCGFLRSEISHYKLKVTQPTKPINTPMDSSREKVIMLGRMKRIKMYYPAISL